MHPYFISHIRKFVPLTEAEVQVLFKYVQSVTAGKKDYLLREGQICRNHYFVENGCLRLFFINEKGVEQITQFAIEGWWLSDYMSFTLQQPAQFSIQAVEHCELFAIDHAAQEKLLQELPQLERYFRIIIQRAYAASQFRLKFLFGYSKEESYHHFIGNFPGFAQRIPQYMLASYLGFTPEYLSEIRKKTGM